MGNMQCDWDGHGEEPDCGVPMHELMMPLDSFPDVPEDMELMDLAVKIQAQYQTLSTDVAWLEPLWQAVNMCSQGQECDFGGNLHVWMWRNLANVALQLYSKNSNLDNAHHAISVSRWAVEVVGDAPIFSALIQVYQLLKHDREALLWCQKAISMGVVNAEILNTMGSILHNHQKWADSLRAFKAANILQPDEAVSINNMVYLKARCAEWDGIDVLIQKMVHAAEGDWDQMHTPEARAAGSSAHPWIFLYFSMSMITKRQVAQMYSVKQHLASRISVPAIAQMEADVAQESKKLLKGMTQWKGYGKERLRVGFVSADFRLKATAYLCAHLFEHIDRSKLEVFLYSTFPDNNVKSGWRKSLEKGAEHFVDLAGLRENVALARIRDDHIHILVDMDGYSNEGQRIPSVFCNRLAPVQMAYFVYIGTLGSPNVDYIVTDLVASPPSSSVGHTEKFLYLPFSFFPNNHAQLFPPPHFGLKGVRQRDLKREIGVSEDTFVFASFNKHMKIAPELFEVWMRILERVPNSVLWMLRFPKDSEDNLLAVAAKHGLERRVLFSDFVETAEANFQRLSGADLILDTTIYGAHTGAVDALYAGKPLLTCIGPKCAAQVLGRTDYLNQGGHASMLGSDSMTGRIAASILVSLGLEEELIVRSLPEYEDRAVQLASEEGRLQALTNKILESRIQKNNFWDTKAYAARLVSGIHAAWEAFLAGETKRHIYSI